MEYTVEDLSPVKKKIHITIDPKEVEASIMAAVALYRTSVQIDGFRKGKVPASVIENRFRDKIYEEAKQDLVNVHINEVVQELKLSPVSPIDFNGKDLKRDEVYAYDISFEVLPAFELPNYEGLEIEQEKVVIADSEVNEFIERLRKDRAELIPIDGKGPAVDGQVVYLDFAAYEDGKALDGVSADNFEMSIGDKQALEDFENLVKNITIGETKEGDVKFPDDFLAPDLAGKTLSIKVTVHAIKERKLPELDDALAKSLGQENVDALRKTFVDSYSQNRENLCKGAAQKQLLDKLLKMVEFELPPSMVEKHAQSLLTDRKVRLERQGRSLDSLGKSIEELQAEVKGEAENIARSQCFLMAVANKENIEVQDQEVDMAIYQLAMRNGEDFKQLKDAYVNSGAIFTLRDRILADKAMENIYTKAKVIEIEPKVAKA